MIKKNILYVTLFLTTLNAFAQTKFVKHYGNQSGEGNSLILNSSGNYIIAGTYFNDFRLAEVNASGDTLWMKRLGTSNTDRASQVVQAGDGGYVCAGSTTGANNYGAVFLSKSNASGIISWTKQIGGQGEENAGAIALLSTGGYMVGGSTKHNSHGMYDFYMIKTDGNGDTLWTRKIGGSQNEEMKAMKQTSDGGFILCGYSQSYTNGAKDGYLVKTNANGDTLWTRHFGGNQDDVFTAVRQTSDGGYIMTGFSYSYSVSTETMFVIKTNANGDTLWTRTYGQSGRFSVGRDIIQTSDGGYALSGSIKTASPNGGYDAYLVKVNASGNVQWEREFKVEPSNPAYTSSDGRSLIQTPDGGFAICGAWFTGSFYEILFIKTDGNGIVGLQEQEVSVAYNLYPNPFTRSAILEFKNLKNVKHSLLLFDYEGRLVKQITDILSDKITIERGDLQQGLYFFRLLSDDGITISGKLMLE